MMTYSGDLLIADEYTEDGRLHMLEDARYATFNEKLMVLDYQKVAVPIKEVVYQNPEWPSTLLTTSHDDLFTHFSGEDQ